MNLSDDQAESLGEAMKSNCSVKHLTLFNNSLSDTRMVKIIKGIALNGYLRILEVGSERAVRSEDA